jgi:chromosome segregation ATPase
MSYRSTRARAILLAATLSSACGGLSYRVERDQLKEITIENKLLLFDAENDVSIALDEREAIHREIQQTKQDIQDADLQVGDAEVDSSRAASKGDKTKEQVADAAAEVFQLKIRYLEDHVAFLRDKLKAQNDLIRVAEAKFELAKAKLAKNNNVRGAADLELADFEGQVDECVERAKATFQALAADEQAVEAVKKVWLDRRDQLMAASGGGAGSPWAEDSALWGREEQ